MTENAQVVVARTMRTTAFPEMFVSVVAGIVSSQALIGIAETIMHHEARERSSPTLTLAYVLTVKTDGL